MADLGHELTDKELKVLEKRIAKEYKTAVKDMEAKLKAYLEQDEKKRLQQEALLKAGKITEQDYKNWCFRHEMMGKRWEDMKNVLAEDMVHTNEIALAMTKKEMPDIYALNANYATYMIEHDGEIDTSFALYNHDTAEYLLGDQRQLMPKPSARKAAQIAANKDMQWNQQKIQSAVLQGVLQGEAPYQVAKRLQSVGQMNYNASVRYARTMTTSAQNAGRYEAYRRADKLGIDLTIEWMATLDQRTRHDHRLMHGQRTTVDEPFHTPDGFTIYYPADSTGDSTAPQSEIWNCRCTIKAMVKGFESDTIKHSDKMGDLSFEEWLEAKPMSKGEQDAWIKAGMPSKEEWNKIKYSKTGSRQRREKLEKITELGNSVENPKENTAVVSELKRIVGEHSRKQDIQAVNPNWSSGSFEWINNCQRCVTTYEARRRGFDVTALPCYSVTTDKFAVGSGFVNAFERGNRKANPLWYELGKPISEARTFSKEECLNAVTSLMNGYGNGSRAFIDGAWSSGAGMHVFVAENINGTIHFFDPQNGSMNCLDYFDRMKPAGISIFRVDDLPFSSEIKDVFKNDII